MKKYFGIFLIISAFALGSELQISFTGNNRGLLTPCGCNIPSGGWPRISTALSEMPPSTLHIGAGNHFFHHTPMPKEDQIFEQKKAALQAELFAELKFDVINAGQFDLCYGLNVLRSLQSRHSLPIISANILDNEGNLAFPPFRVIHFQGLDIMFVGICSLSDGFNFHIKDPLLTLKELYRDGIFEDADMVILLADAPAVILSEFVKDYDGIDLIVCAKEHAFTGLPVHYKGTALTQLGSQGKYLGNLLIHFDDKISEWKDISPYKHSIETAENALISRSDQKKKFQKQLKRNKKIIKSEIRHNSRYYHWEMLLLDSSVKDDPVIKKRVEEFTGDQ
ncbi:MAG: hypothetical protein K9N05_01965 [Candidatus Marinimicrobia bacterium]|nr:hypothetical protein [Candidatus Neomarinimicrobiota bacterium]